MKKLLTLLLFAILPITGSNEQKVPEYSSFSIGRFIVFITDRGYQAYNGIYSDYYRYASQAVNEIK